MNLGAFTMVMQQAIPVVATVSAALEDDGKIDLEEALTIGLSLTVRILRQTGKPAVIDMSLVEAALIEAGATVVHSREIDAA